jgi:uncharacterized protein
VLDRWRDQMLGRWAQTVCRHPWPVLVTALLVAAAAIAVTVLRLEFQSDRNDLISRELDWNARYIEYRDKLEGRDRIVVIVQVPREPGGRQRAQEFVAQLASLVEADPHVARVWWRIEANPLLARLLPMEQYARQMAQISQSGPLLRSSSIGQFIAALTAEMRAGQDQTDERQAAEQIGQLEAAIGAIGRALSGADPAAALEKAGLAPNPDHEPIATPDGQYMLLDIEVRPLEGEVDPFAPGVAAVRRGLAQVQQKAGVRAGLTGIPVIEADETIVSMRDSTRASVLAVIAIAALLIFALHGWVLPVLSVAALLVGVAWSFGFLTLAIGHLQVLSVVFTVILLGLGIDFAIHTICRFELVRHEHTDDAAGFCATLADTLRTTGPGIITGALTTAIAFSTTWRKWG